MLSGGGVDVKSGTVQIFGYGLKVSPAIAQVVAPFYNQILKTIAVEGGRVAFKHGYELPKKFGASNPLAYGIARIAEFAWQFGPTIADTSLNVHKSIKAGYDEGAKVRELLSPYLAANHNMNTGITAFMSDSNRGVQNVRAYIAKRSKNSLMANFADFTAKIPALMLIHWQRKLDDINNHERFRDAYDPADSAKADAHIEELKALKEPNTSGENNALGRLDRLSSDIKQDADFIKWQRTNHGGEPLQFLIQTRPMQVWNQLTGSGNAKDIFTQIFKPKHANELELNLRLFNFAPAFGGFISQFLREKLVTRDSRSLEDFAVIKAGMLAQQLKKNPPEDHAELTEQIYSLFKQQFKDCGNTKDLSQKNNEKLNKVCNEVASAIMDGELNPYALVDLIGGDKLVKYSKGEFVFTSTHERAEVMEKELTKYTDKVDNKEFYKDLGIKPEDLGKIYNGMGAEERSFFVMLFPPGILEKQGINRQELAKIRKSNRDEFIGTLAQALISVKDMSSEELKQKYGVPEDAAKALLSVAEDLSESSKYGEREVENYVEKHQREVSKAVAKAGIASNNPNFWRELVGKGKEQGPQEINTGGVDGVSKSILSDIDQIGGNRLDRSEPKRGSDYVRKSSDRDTSEEYVHR